MKKIKRLLGVIRLFHTFKHHYGWCAGFRFCRIFVRAETDIERAKKIEAAWLKEADRCSVRGEKIGADMFYELAGSMKFHIDYHASLVRIGNPVMLEHRYDILAYNEAAASMVVAIYDDKPDAYIEFMLPAMVAFKTVDEKMGLLHYSRIWKAAVNYELDRMDEEAKKLLTARANRIIKELNDHFNKEEQGKSLGGDNPA